MTKYQITLQNPAVMRALELLSTEDLHQLELRPMHTLTPLLQAGFARVVDRSADHRGWWAQRISITPTGREFLAAAIKAETPAGLTAEVSGR
jgi:hypothetical protein